jgi:hypothetical protein
MVAVVATLFLLLVNAVVAGTVRNCAGNQRISAKISPMLIAKNVRIPYATPHDYAAVIGLEEGHVVIGKCCVTKERDIVESICSRTSCAGIWRRNKFSHVGWLRYGGFAEKIIGRNRSGFTRPDMGVSRFVNGRGFSVIDVLNVPPGLLSAFKLHRLTFNVLNEKIGPLVHLKIFLGDIDLFSGLFSRIDRGGDDADSEDRVNPNSNTRDTRPTKGLVVVLIALALRGFVASMKGIYSENYLLIIGGWLVSAVAVAVGTIGLSVAILRSFLKASPPALGSTRQQRAIAVPKISALARLLYRNSNSAT